MFIMKKIIYLFLILFHGFTLVTGQTIRFVKPVPSGLGDGSSWENASGDLMLMVNNSKPGDYVWVVEGEYLGDASSSSSFFLKEGITLLGGFPASMEGTLENRNPAAHLTILKAVGSQRVLRFPASASQTICDGFVLQGGNLPSLQGGGAFLEYQSVLRNCIIRHCHAALGGASISSMEVKSIIV